MFRVRESESAGGYSAAEWVVQITLLVALLANLATDYWIIQEYRRLTTALHDPEPWLPSTLPSLRKDIAIQLAANLVVTPLLASCVCAIWWRRRRYLTEQKRFRQLKMLAHDILASMDYGVVTTNRDAIITSINSAAIGLLGVDFECVGRPLASISPPGVSLVQIYQEVIGNRTSANEQDWQVDRAGRRRKLQIDGQALKDIQGVSLGCVIHLRDVTERMLLEERMRRMERFLGLANLASGLHHEIKNPLTALSIHIQLLEERLSNEQSEEPIDELVGVLKTEVCRLNGVLESFRSFAHMQKLTILPTDALGVIEKVIRLIRPQAAEQHVQIALLHPERELPPVRLDAEKFEQVVLNLVINALDAMPEGGQLTLSAAIADSALRVSVQDSGPGIPAEIQRSVFQPYFSTKTKGSGMGLALSEKLVGQHGGRIEYRTGPEGTTFEIAIPLEQRSENA